MNSYSSSSTGSGALSAAMQGLPPVIDVTFSGGTRYKLTSAEEVGRGGEGVVYRVPNQPQGGKQLAVKVILPARRDAIRFNKLQAFLAAGKGLPQEAVLALDMGFDTATRQPIASLMELVDMSKYHTLAALLVPDDRSRYNMDFNDYVTVFKLLRNVLAQLQAKGFLIGDFNAGAVLVLDKQYWNTNLPRIRIVDTDSFQFGQYPCVAYSIKYLDWKLNKIIDIAGNEVVLKVPYDKVYTQQVDWFSFDALMYEALTMANVYQSGWHEHYDNIQSRFRHGLTVLHPTVDYPASCVPITNLPPVLQTHFKGSFVDGTRTLLPSQTFDVLLGNTAQPVNLQPQQMAVVPNARTSGVKEYQVVLNMLDNIEDVYYDGGLIQVLTRKNAKTNEYTLWQHDNQSYRNVFQGQQGEHYSIGGDGTIIGYLDNDKTHFKVWQTRTNNRNGGWNTYTTKTGFQGEPVMGAGAGRVFTMNDKNVTSESIEQQGYYTNLFPSSQAISLYVDAATGNSFAVARYGTSHIWFFSRNGVGTFQVQLPELDPSEVVVPRGIGAAYLNNSILIVRVTETNGLTRTRFDEISLSEKVRDSERLLAGAGHIVDGRPIRNLNGIAYVSSGMYAWATDAGIQVANRGKLQTFKQTKPYVRAGYSLKATRNGILIFGDGKVAHVIV